MSIDLVARLNRLRAGDVCGVFIDDTGIPGRTEFKTLHPERQSWVAVVIHPDLMPEVLEQMPGAINELTGLSEANEFHFTEIWNGKGKYRDNIPLRIALVEFMSYIFERYEFPVYVQTQDPNTLPDWHQVGRLSENVEGFDFSRPKDAALYLLIQRVAVHLQKSFPGRTNVASVFVDEEFKSSGTILKIPEHKNLFVDGGVCFAPSHVVYPLQLADFAAFVLNRQQINNDKLLSGQTLNSLDSVFMHAVEKMQKSFKNIKQIYHEVTPVYCGGCAREYLVPASEIKIGGVWPCPKCKTSYPIDADSFESPSSE